MERKTIIFAGGGTGGHLFPGIAVAEELLHRDPSSLALFAGSEREVEAAIIAKQGFEHITLPATPSSSWKRRPLHFLRTNWRALRAARRLIAERQPAAVVGLGGFASVPVVVAASSARVPVVLLEQNLIPGRATRWLKRRANLICVSFDETVSELGNSPNLCVTGNPVRRAIADLLGNDDPITSSTVSNNVATKKLLVLGGSQGSTAVNAAVLGALQTLHHELKGWQIVHQTGPADLENVRRQYAEHSIDATVAPFLDDMPEQYRAASLVVSRAGATTLAELACAGCPALLIPYPNAIGDHQTYNARAFEKAGAARVVPQQSDPAQTAATLAETLRPLLADSAVRDTMRAGMRSLARPDAASEVVDLLLTLAR